MGKSIDNRLRDFRTKQQITQAALGHDVGVSRQTIISLESGRYAPSLELGLRIARRFDSAVEDIFWLVEP